MMNETFDLGRFWTLREDLDESIEREVTRRSVFNAESSKQSFHLERNSTDMDDPSNEEPVESIHTSSAGDIPFSMSDATKAALQALGERTHHHRLIGRGSFHSVLSREAATSQNDSPADDKPQQALPLPLSKGAASWRLLFGCSPPTVITDSGSIRLDNEVVPHLKRVFHEEDSPSPSKRKTTQAQRLLLRSDQDALLKLGSLIKGEARVLHTDSEVEILPTKQQIKKRYTPRITTSFAWFVTIALLFFSWAFLRRDSAKLVADRKPMGHVPWVKSATDASFRDLQRYIAKEQALMLSKEGQVANKDLVSDL